MGVVAAVEDVEEVSLFDFLIEINRCITGGGDRGGFRGGRGKFWFNLILSIAIYLGGDRGGRGKIFEQWKIWIYNLIKGTRGGGIRGGGREYLLINSILFQKKAFF